MLVAIAELGSAPKLFVVVVAMVSVPLQATANELARRSAPDATELVVPVANGARVEAARRSPGFSADTVRATS